MICGIFKKKKKEEKRKPFITPWTQVAIKELGQAEVVGKKHNPRILEYHEATTLKARTDEIAWCASFLNWCLLKSKLPKTNKATAQSFLNWGYALEGPKRECICVIKRGSKAWMGHVFIVMKYDKKYIWALGGNQGNAVSIKKYRRSKVMGYRWLDWEKRK